MRAERPDLKARVLELLEHHHGPDNAITMTRLFAAATGEIVIPNRRYDQSRIIRSIIDELRRQGVPVGIASDGYFLARDAEELASTIDWFHARALSHMRVEKHLRRIDPARLTEQYRLELSTED